MLSVLPAPKTLGQIGYFISYFLTGTYCAFLIPLSPLTLLSLYYTFHLMVLFPSCFRNFSFACSTITCSLTEEILAPKRDVIDRAGGLAEVGVPLWTSLPACLPSSMVLSSTRVVLHADDECEVIQLENEKAGVGGTEGRKDAALCFYSTWRNEMETGREEEQEKVKRAQVISSKSPLLSARD